MFLFLHDLFLRASGETHEVYIWAVPDVKVESLVSALVNLWQFITLWSRWPGKRNKKDLLPASGWNLHIDMSPPWHTQHTEEKEETELE